MSPGGGATVPGMSDNTPKSKLSPPMLATLGLTGMFTAAVRCGPCLDYAYPDTATDTGDTGDTGDTEEDRPGEDRAAATERVLERGVLPDDVAKILGNKPTQ